MDFEAPPMAGWKRALAWIPVALGALGALIGGGVLFAPTHVAYTLGPDTFTAQASLGPLDLGRQALRSEVRGGRRQALHHGLRTAGTARGDFCQGKWWFDETGPAWVAGTCVPDTVVVDVGDEHWVLTPADPAAFLAALDGGAGEFAAAPNPDSQTTGAILLLGLLLLPLVVIFPLIGRRLSQPLVYRIVGATLSVPGNLWTTHLKLDGATFTHAPLGRAWRLAGTALPGLLLGAFRAGGKHVHVAARDLKTGVRIDGTRSVYVTPADVDAFCAALVRGGARPG